MASSSLEANATRLDCDYAAIVNWRAAEQAVKDGKATMMAGVPVLDPAKVPGVLYPARSEECVAHIGEIWTDMRPLSLRQRMAAQNA